MFDQSGDVPHVVMTLDERAVKALHSSVVFTLDKWAGQGEIDQEELIDLKTFLQGAVFEFQFNR